MYRTFFFGCIVSGVYISTVCAQEIIQLDKIQVQDHASVIEERQENSIAKRIIKGEELTRYGDLNALEMLKRTPGVAINEGKGKKGKPARGYTKILVDGEEVSTASRRGTPLEQISPDMIERLEIMTNGSAEHTAEAMGGIVNIILKAPKSESKTTAKISAGAYNEQPMGSVFGQYEGKTGNFSKLINISASENRFKDEASNHIAYADGSFSDEMISDASRMRMLNLNTKLLLASSAKAKYTFDGSFALSDSRGLSDANTYENAIPLPSQTLHTGEDSRGMMLWTKLSGEHHLSGTEMAEWKIKYHHNIQEGERRSISNTADSLQEEETLFRIFGMEGSYSNVMGDHFIKTGVDYRRMLQYDDIKTYANGTDVSMSDQRMRQEKGALYLQDEITIGEKAVITPGIRYEKVSRDFTTAWDKDYFAPSLHFMYRLNAQDNLRASVAKTVKLPTFQELSISTDSTLSQNDLNHPDTTGNPNLKEETALSYELRLEHYFDDKGIASIGGFYRSIEDKIEKMTTLEAGRYVERPYNAGEGKLWGIELELKKSLTAYISGLDMFANATIQDSSLETNGITRSIKGTSDYFYNIGLDHTLPSYRLTYGAAYRYVGGYDDPMDQQGVAESQEGYGTLDLYAMKRINTQYKIGINLKNITSKTITSTTKRYESGSVEEIQTDHEHSKPHILITLEGRW